jgi:luciferase family oxidoreductase group 1
MIKLSVLDQSPIRKGDSPAQAIQETIELAQFCDALGYRRYWLAEHHSSEALAGSTPEILVGHVAGATKKIRVGSGGVMLSHYSPLKVAENFRMLETLYPGRIDIGFGRAPGSDYQTAQALAAGPGALSAEYFPHQVNMLREFLDDKVSSEHNFSNIHAQPVGPTSPESWLLGSSDQSAMLTAHFGLPFSFAHFITSRGGATVMGGYQRNFRPSDRCPSPQGSVGIFLICTDTEAEAERLALSRNIFLIKLRRGQPAPIVPPEEAAAYEMDSQDREIVADAQGRTIVGDPEQVKQQITELANAFEVNEVLIVTITYDFSARKRSYELIAEAFAL